jgi:methionine synthase II (cobalamin-independent)
MAYDRPMFATLARGYPARDRVGATPGDLDERVRTVIAEQIEAGLGLLSDGSQRWPDPAGAFGRALIPRPGAGPERAGPLTVDAWSFAQEVAGQLPVKQCLPGPYTLGRRCAASDGERRELTTALAAVLAEELADLAAAGCPFIQVDEDDAVLIGPDETERALFVEAHARLLARLGRDGERPHLSLAIVGGNADEAGPETIFGPAYDSHLFDLLSGPDNWRLITGAPAERGMILGVADARSPRTDDPATIVWAVGYAASGGRGEARIGIAPSGDLAGLPGEVARAKIETLGEVVRLVEMRREAAIAASLDPRATDARSAALGSWRSRRRSSGPGEPGPPTT